MEDKDLCPLMYSVQMCVFRVHGLFEDTVMSCSSDIFVNFTASTNHCRPNDTIIALKTQACVGKVFCLFYLILYRRVVMPSFLLEIKHRTSATIFLDLIFGMLRVPS